MSAAPETQQGLTAEKLANVPEVRDARRAIERQLILLMQASGALLASPASADAMRTILELAQHFIDADAYAVWRKQRPPNEWALAASFGLSDNYQRTWENCEVETSLPDEPIVIEDVARSPMAGPRAAVYEREGIRSMLMVPLRILGGVTGTLVFYYRSPHQFSEETVRIAAAVGKLVASALGTAELYNLESDLRAAAETAERRTQFLAQASEVLSSSLEYEATLAAVAKLAVPFFADWCTVDLVDADGNLQRAVVQHSDPKKLEFAREFRGSYPPRENDANVVALRTGRAMLMEEIPDALIAERAVDSKHLELIRSIGLNSIIIVPMMARGRTLGVLSFITAESGRHYTEADLKFAQELAGRAAIAVDNARLYRDVQDGAQRFRRAVVDAPMPIMIHADNGEVLSLSKAWTKISGYTHEDIPTIEAWTSRACRERASEFRKVIEQTHRLQEPAESWEDQIVAKDGEKRDWLFSTAPLGRLPDGRRVQISAAMDISEQKRMQAAAQYLAAIVESSSDAIVSKDLNGIVTSWNKGAERIFGYTAEEMIGQPISVLAAPDRIDEFPGILEQIKRGERVGTFETVRRTKGGRLIEVSLTVSPVRDERGRIIGASKIARDISQTKEAERELVRQADSLARSNAELQQFGHIASHDLQEPLRNVTTFAQLLMKHYKDSLDSRGQNFVNVIVTGAKHMTDLVNDMLGYSRLTSAEPRKLAAVDLNEAVESAMSNLQTAILDSAAVIHVGRLPTVDWDKVQLVQVFQNLISNAIKYRAGHAPDIKIGAEQQDGQWIISVQDNGIGIPSEYHDQIFRVFNRLHGREYPGTGIGLAICKKIVEEHHGRIWVESAGSGTGSTFRFCFRDHE